MEKARLAVHYCGGCREEYDRLSLVRDLLKTLRDMGLEVEPVYGGEAPVGILVCGCPAQCPRRDEKMPGNWHYLAPNNRFDAVPLPLERIAAILRDELRPGNM